MRCLSLRGVEEKSRKLENNSCRIVPRGCRMHWHPKTSEADRKVENGHWLALLCAHFSCPRKHTPENMSAVSFLAASSKPE